MSHYLGRIAPHSPFRGESRASWMEAECSCGIRILAMDVEEVRATFERHLVHVLRVANPRGAKS